MIPVTDELPADLLHLLEVIISIILIPFSTDLLQRIDRIENYVVENLERFAAMFGLGYMALAWWLITPDTTTLVDWLQKGLAAGMGGVLVNASTHHRRRTLNGQPPSEGTGVTNLRRMIQGKKGDED